MGQENSYLAHPGSTQTTKYKTSYEDPVQYRNSSLDYRAEFQEIDYKRRKSRTSSLSFNSDNSSTESSGYRSGSSGYDYQSDRSSRREYYCTSLYKNDHYKSDNKELYRPVKIPKDKRYTLELFNVDKELKSSRLKNYIRDTEKEKLNAEPKEKKSGIRNYTPKILSEEEHKKKQENRKNWI